MEISIWTFADHLRATRHCLEAATSSAGLQRRDAQVLLSNWTATPAPLLSLPKRPEQRGRLLWLESHMRGDGGGLICWTACKRPRGLKVEEWAIFQSADLLTEEGPRPSLKSSVFWPTRLQAPIQKIHQPWHHFLKLIYQLQKKKIERCWNMLVLLSGIAAR